MIFKGIQKVFQWNHQGHTKYKWELSTKEVSKKRINEIVGYLENEINWQVISYTERQQDRERQRDRKIGEEKDHIANVTNKKSYILFRK